MVGQPTTVISVVTILAVCTVLDRSATSVSAVAEYLSKPSIHSDTNDRVPFGKPIRLVCEVNIQAGINISITWKAPANLMVDSKTENRIKIGPLKVTPVKNAEHREIASQELFIQRASKADNGTYRCEVRDIYNRRKYHSFTLHVRESSEDYVILPEDYVTDLHHYSSLSHILIGYRSYPTNITYYLVNGTGSKITEGHQGKYELSHNDTHVKLRFTDPSVYDTGNYTLFVMAGKAENSFRIRVNFFAKPIVQMESKFGKPGKQVSFTCRTIGYPKPDISFAFVPCWRKPWTNCSMPVSASMKWDASSGTGETLITNVSTHTITPTQPGVVYCKATNIEGSAVTQADLLISDLPDAITLVKERPKETITVGDHVTIVCSALVYNYTNDITFVHNDKELQASDGVSHSYSPKQYAWQARLDIKNVTKDHKGLISCRVKTMDNAVEARSFDVQVLDPVAPMLRSGKNNETLSVDLQGQLKLQCDVGGTPDPKIVWFKDGEPVRPDKNNKRMKLSNTTLIFENLKTDDLGKFECQARNKFGSIKKYWKVNERTPFHTGTLLIYINIGLMVALIVGILLVSMFYCMKKKEVEEIKKTGFANFEKGGFDPRLAFDKLCNAEYEFPKERLKLKKKLGNGAFGVVMKATATRIIENEEKTTVAVKMLKKATNYECWRALVSELTILVHLGQHLNVVNLLGAVTKNIAKRELMVIVEYCRFGNVKDFLRNHRPHFIDQINQETDEIDSSINKNQLSRSKCDYQYNKHVYTKKHSNSKRNVTHPQKPQNRGIEKSCNSEVTAMISVAVEDLSTVNSNDMRSNNGMNYKGARSVNTTDLVCWASQIACGMDYLVSRNVLHGDLAARNILLCDGNVVKICDFGFGRLLNNDKNYKKKGKEPLPFMWLAPECMRDNVFSTYSDVWAYGIVLWELFSLGMVPYTGMEANEELSIKLRNGYRMDKPQYSNKKIYDVMRSCWHETPDSRPSFENLKSRFNAMLPTDLQDRYRKLNEPYLQMNRKRMERGETDYQTNLGQAENLASNYVNGFILPFLPNSEIHNDNHYMKMSRPKSESMEDNFDLNSDCQSPAININCDDTPPNVSRRNKKRNLPEEIPMLDGKRLSSVGNAVSSDSETEMISPNL